MVTKFGHIFCLWYNQREISNLYQRLYRHLTNCFCDCLGDCALPAAPVLTITSSVSYSHCENSQSQHFDFLLERTSSSGDRDPEESSEDSYWDSAKPNLLLKLPQHFPFINTLQTKSAPSDVFTKKKIKGPDLVVIYIWEGKNKNTECISFCKSVLAWND